QSSLVPSRQTLNTLRLSTRHLTQAQYGYAETLLTFIILSSIVLRFGIGEALLRVWFDDDDAQRRDRLGGAASGFTFVTTTLVAGLALVFSEPLSRLILATDD